MASVKVDGLTKVQANGLAILFEDGTIAKMVNNKLREMDLEDEAKLDEYPSVNFDESEHDPDHEVEFS